MPFEGPYVPDVKVLDIDDDPILLGLTQGRKRVKAGWLQGRAYESIFGNDHYCAIGAVSSNRKQILYLARALPIQWRLCTWSSHYDEAEVATGRIIAFNDAIWRSRWGVIRLFNRAIRLRRRELQRAMRSLG